MTPRPFQHWIFSICDCPSQLIFISDLQSKEDVLKALIHRQIWGSELVYPTLGEEYMLSEVSSEYNAQQRLFPAKAVESYEWLAELLRNSTSLSHQQRLILSQLDETTSTRTASLIQQCQTFRNTDPSVEARLITTLLETASKWNDHNLEFKQVLELFTPSKTQQHSELDAIDTHTKAEDWISKAEQDGLFSEDFYRETNPDLPKDTDFPVHFIEHGWREGRDPSQYFSVTRYNSAYPDVYAAGVNPLRHFIEYGQDRQRFPSSSFEQSRQMHPESVDLSLLRIPEAFDTRTYRLAILIHIHYSDVLNSIIEKLARLEIDFDLLISTTSEKTSSELQETLKGTKYAGCSIVRTSENRGRDVGAFINCFIDKYGEYDLICKLHGKKSPHLKHFGAHWFDYLIESSIGSNELVRQIIFFFSMCSRAGVFAPVPFKGTNNSDWADNLNIAKELVSQLSEQDAQNLAHEPLAYPSATVFWFRPQALVELYGRYKPEQFPAEPLPIDATIAHAIERLIPYFTTRSGYTFMCYKQRLAEIRIAKEHSIIEFLKHDNSSNKKKILLFSHDASNTGAPRTAIGIHSALNRTAEYECLAILLGGGPLEEDFKQAGPTITFPNGIGMDVLSDIFQASNSRLSVVCNTCVTSNIGRLARNYGHHAVSLVHEYASTGYWPKEFFIDALQADVTVFPGTSVLETAVDYTSILPANELILRPQGIYRDAFPEVSVKEARLSVRKELDLSDDTILILGCGMLERRKGIDLFLDVAMELGQRPHFNKYSISFLWIGAVPPSEKEFAQFQLERLSEYEHSNVTIQILSSVKKTDRYFAASDIFFLSSRFDPFPGVVLEGMACKLPIVCFKPATDATTAFINQCGGIAIETFSAVHAADAIYSLAENKRLRREMGIFGEKRLRSEYTFKRYMETMAVALVPTSARAETGNSGHQSNESPIKQDPIFSIVVPAYKTPLLFLQQMLDSVIRQSYQRFELVVAASNFSKQEIALLEFYANAHPGIKPIFLERNLGIAGNTNSALAQATGTHVCFLDHDDMLHAKCLERITDCIGSTSADFIYTDEDKVDYGGALYHGPVRKPEFSQQLLESHNYITHLTVIGKQLLQKTGEISSDYDGAQDYDFILRATELATSIVHIPEVLYHWRESEGSTSTGLSDAKPYAVDAGRRALEARLMRQGRKHEAVTSTETPFVYKVVNK